MLGSDSRWSDCRGHIPNRHSVLPVRDSHRTNGPRCWAGAAASAPEARPRASAYLAALVLETLPALLSGTNLPWVDEGTALSSRRLGAAPSQTRAAALALAEWLALLSLNLGFRSRMGTQDPRRAPERSQMSWSQDRGSSWLPPRREPAQLHASPIC